jgi:hypothetical protein
MQVGPQTRVVRRSSKAEPGVYLARADDNLFHNCPGRSKQSRQPYDPSLQEKGNDFQNDHQCRLGESKQSQNAAVQKTKVGIDIQFSQVLYGLGGGLPLKVYYVLRNVRCLQCGH